MTTNDPALGVTLPDEDVLRLPEEWLTEIFPRRDGLLGPPITLDDTAVEVIARHEQKIHDVVRQMGGDPTLAEAARAHLRGEVTPLSAAVIATIATEEAHWEQWDEIKLFADAWIATRGLTFAAEATAELARVYDHKSMSRTRYNYLRFRTSDDDDWGVGTNEEIAGRVRAFLAVADEPDYRDAVNALAKHRTTDFQRTVVSFLVPTETAWVDEICLAASTVDLEQVQWRLLLSSVGSTRQLDLLRTRDRSWNWIAREELLGSLLAAVGTGLLPVLTVDSGPVEPNYALGLASLPSDETIALLVSKLDQPRVRPAVRHAMRNFPVRALHVLATASTRTSTAATHAAQLLRAHVRDNPELVAAVLPTLPPEIRAAVDRVDARLGWVPETDTPPELLAAPPWTRVRKPARRTVVKKLSPTVAWTATWEPGEREQWEATRDYDPGRFTNADWATEIKSAQQSGLSEEDAPAFFAEAPVDLARPLLSYKMSAQQWDPATVKRLVARYELDAAPIAERVARSNPAEHADKLLPLLTLRIAQLMADWLVRLDAVRPTVVRWFQRHGLGAARALIPDALGKPSAERCNAEAALRLIAEHIGVADVVAAAGEHGDKPEKAVETLLSNDPLHFFPTKAKMPDIASQFDLDLLPQVLLRDRRQALSRDATVNLITMLALSQPGDLYPGVAVVKDQLDPTSLAELGWALFEQTERDGWALAALAAIGNDDTARRLAPLIRTWPSQGGHSHTRAAVGLDVLAAIGTDTALIYLHDIASTTSSQRVEARAWQKVNQLAGERGLTAEQLADRLVPDFGLDARGSLTLDYGPRRFTVGFDEQLKPYVADEDGTRRKDLPKPGTRDDRDLAPAAYQRFAGLKKDVRTVAAGQLQRFEQAMVGQRRWTLSEFRQLFVEHPLLWHIVRRLVWIAPLTDKTGRSFRVAEDRTLADHEDNPITLPDTALVSIAHPLHLADTRDDWARVFDDYEITQPFAQLHRAVHALTEEERTSSELARFQGNTVSTFRVLGLEKHGWQRSTDRSSGMESCILRPIPGNRAVVVDLDPGIYVGDVRYYPEQSLAGVWISPSRHGYRPSAEPISFAELDPVTASEVLRELTELTG